ncbi:MAG: hydrogenase-4 component G [Desulfobacteraceae bacterium]|nr:hydrogenase-4 component G [Desulfobacteraceae bacterium]
MVSVQTNLYVLSGVKKFSFQRTGQVLNKQNKLDYSVKSEVFQFSLLAKTDTRQKLSDQNAIFYFNQLSKEDKASLLYEGNPISELSVDEAGALVEEDGYFGVDKTSQRIIDFVIKGAGGDLSKLKAGREGVLRGFSEAGKAWGGELPDISYKTIERAIKVLDEKIADLGGNTTGITV